MLVRQCLVGNAVRVMVFLALVSGCCGSRTQFCAEPDSVRAPDDAVEVADPGVNGRRVAPDIPCQPDCEGKECGDDGCGGQCPSVCDPEGQSCVDGVCVDGACEPPCGEFEECFLTKTGWQCVAEWMPVPAGDFWMGCNPYVVVDAPFVPEQCSHFQLPLHWVHLPEYAIGRSAVTVEQYRACVDAGICLAPEFHEVYCHPEPSTYDEGLDNHPVNCVDWYRARYYCQWLCLDCDLCTEAQWEKAARGGCEYYDSMGLDCETDAYYFPWGQEEGGCEHAACPGIGMGKCEDCLGEDEDSAPVCSRSPLGDSPYGVCDMAGNFMEWTRDWFHPAYYCDGQWDSKCTEDSDWPGAPAAWESPQGPFSGHIRTTRNGYGSLLEISHREFLKPAASSPLVGFRCCRKLSEER